MSRPEKCIKGLLICFCLAVFNAAALADGQASSIKKNKCDAVFLSGWKNQVVTSSATEICAQHPWVKKLNAWLDSQMNQEEAELLLISSTREFETPQALQQAEKMVAAAVLARSGQTIEARQLWKALTIEKPKWAEPWFNLGLLNVREGHREQALFCFLRGRDLCRQHACRVPFDVWDTLLAQLENSP